MKDIAVLFLNWNGYEDTVECMETVFSQDYERFQVILFDNGSTDGSYEKLIQYLEGKADLSFLSQCVQPDILGTPVSEKRSFHISNGTDYNEKADVIVLRNEKNAGFAPCCNQGIRYCLQRSFFMRILILNNDVLLFPGMISRMNKTMDNNIDIGVLGTKVYFYEPGRRIQSMGGRFIFADWELFRSHEELEMFGDDLGEGVFRTSVLTGCALMIKRELLEKQLIPEEYYHFWEDLEFFYRVARQGHMIAIDTKAELTHKGGASSGYHHGPTYFSSYYGLRNKIMFTRRNLPFSERFYIYSNFITRMLIRIIFYRIPFEVKKGMLSGIIDGIRGIKGKTV